jgi:sugar phosphate isomerase/epimerase
LVKSCAAMFADAGARMAVEFSPLGSVASIRDGLQVVAAAGTDRAGLLIDTWHFFSGDSTWEDLAEVPLELIGYVQFDDALPRISEDPMDETMNRRTMPGDGTFDLERFATTLLARGWSGLVSVEVLNRDLAKLPVAEFARLAYTSSARYWL